MENPCECGIEHPGSISNGVKSFKPIGKRPFGRPRRRWEDNIRMDLEEIGRPMNTRN